MQFIKTLITLSLAAFALAAPSVAPVEKAAAINPEGVGGVKRDLVSGLPVVGNLGSEAGNLLNGGLPVVGNVLKGLR
ncbi:hypothetical protein B0F90DRAFT_1785094 [Multifurca ochricompacta]|uniref:Uncharacterized protein n=1 Tax=Multifurca ochricompacta TaxID=376703 RepID=A0AAD4LUA9_9AGAM|nr:hypothetical protein B0F90DRAFT_1785094 [Multifurca ochricompacta]